MFVIRIKSNRKPTIEGLTVKEEIMELTKLTGYATLADVINLFEMNITFGQTAIHYGWTADQIMTGFNECGEYFLDTDITTIAYTLPDPSILDNINYEVVKGDPVSTPSHYIDGRKYEPRKVIYDWGLNFNLGNAVKYLSRAGRKNDKTEDLKKAIKYIEFELEEMEREDQNVCN